MVERSTRFEIEQPVEFWLADIGDAPRMNGRTVNISSCGVLIQTDQNIAVGRKIEIIVRMARLSPESMDVDLRLLAMTVRSGPGFVAAHVKKYQILPRQTRLVAEQGQEQADKQPAE